MYGKILVPLDGSEFAECALGHAGEIAKGCGQAGIVLLTAVPGATEDGGFTWGGVISAAHENERLARADEAAAEYLNGVAEKLKRDGFTAEGCIVRGSPAEAVLNYVRNNPVDLIVMSSHGRSGPSRWAMGSVADKIVRSAETPVLVASPKGCRVD